MQELVEVAHAAERPADCHIRIFLVENDTFVIEIPARGAPIAFGITVTWLLICLSVTVYSSVRILILHQPVPLIAPAGISPYLRVWSIPLLLLVALYCSLAFAALTSLFRPVLQTERIVVDSKSISYQRRMFGRTKLNVIPKQNFSNVRIETAEHGLTQSELLLIERDRTHSIAANTRAIDREWLYSVLSVLLNE